MPGYVPHMRLEIKRRADDEIIWSDKIGVRVGGTIGFIIATVVTSGILSETLKLFRTWNRSLFTWDVAVLYTGGCVFSIWIWLHFAAALRDSWSRRTYILRPGA